MIPYGKHSLSKSDIKSVVNVLNSDFLTQGPKVEEFENNISRYCGSKYSVAVNSATSALHIACLSLNLGKGDYLWTSAISFVASSNCGLYCGAKVDFIDIDSNSYNLSIEHLEKKLKRAKKEKKLPKVLVNVHLSGQPSNLEKIKKLSLKYKFKIIEDASHAIGARYKKDLIGNCKYSDITVFSFHPVKIITTAEGGMATTNNKKLFEKMKILRTHGIIKNNNSSKTSFNPSLHYDQIDLGFNYRMNDLQAALGSSQLKKINKNIKKRRNIASYYDEKLLELPVKLPARSKNSLSSHHLYIIRLDEHLKKTKKEIIEIFRKKGVILSFHYMPIFLHSFYRNFTIKHDEYPESLKYYKDAISIPIYPTLSKKNQDLVINLIKENIF